MAKGKEKNVLNVGKRNHYLDILFNAMGARDTIANDAHVVSHLLRNINKLLTPVLHVDKMYKLIKIKLSSTKQINCFHYF